MGEGRFLYLGGVLWSAIIALLKRPQASPAPPYYRNSIGMLRNSGLK
jgi:hypothetical protein